MMTPNAKSVAVQKVSALSLQAYSVWANRHPVLRAVFWAADGSIPLEWRLQAEHPVRHGLRRESVAYAATDPS